MNYFAVALEKKDQGNYTAFEDGGLWDDEDELIQALRLRCEGEVFEVGEDLLPAGSEDIRHAIEIPFEVYRTFVSVVEGWPSYFVISRSEKVSDDYEVCQRKIEIVQNTLSIIPNKIKEHEQKMANRILELGDENLMRLMDEKRGFGMEFELLGLELNELNAKKQNLLVALGHGEE